MWPSLSGPMPLHLMVRAEIVPVREQVDRGALVVLEREHLAHAGDGIVAQLARDAVGREALGQLAEIGIGRDLERQPRAGRAVGLFELNHQEAGLGGEERAVLLALGEHEAGDVGPIGDLLVEVLGLERRMSDASRLDHGESPEICGLAVSSIAHSTRAETGHHLAKARRIWRKVARQMAEREQSAHGRATSSRPINPPTARAPASSSTTRCSTPPS